MKNAAKRDESIRRSIVLSRQLLEEAMKAAPAELRGNVNGLVRVALQEFVARQREGEFARAMAEMAQDPAIRRASRAVSREFREAESDRL